MLYHLFADLKTWPIYSIGYTVAQESEENLKKGKIDLHQTNQACEAIKDKLP